MHCMIGDRTETLDAGEGKVEDGPKRGIPLGDDGVRGHEGAEHDPDHEQPPDPAEAEEHVAHAGHVAYPNRGPGGYDAQRNQPVHAGHCIGIDRVGAISAEGYAEVVLSSHDD